MLLCRVFGDQVLGYEYTVGLSTDTISPTAKEKQFISITISLLFHWIELCIITKIPLNC